jgi:hypothetical protein
MNKNFLAPFKDLLLELRNTVSENNPPVTCIVSDPFAPISIKAGEEVGLPVVMYATMNACGYMGFKQLHALRERGFTPIKGNNSHACLLFKLSSITSELPSKVALLHHYTTSLVFCS